MLVFEGRVGGEEGKRGRKEGGRERGREGEGYGHTYTPPVLTRSNL